MISHLRHVLRRPSRRQRHSLVGVGLVGQSPAIFQIGARARGEDDKKERFTVSYTDA